MKKAGESRKGEGWLKLETYPKLNEMERMKGHIIEVDPVRNRTMELSPRLLF